MKTSVHTSPTTLAIPVEPGDHTLGDASARITVVEYGDFECPTCKIAAPAVKLLAEEFSHRIRVVFRHFPREDAHPHALPAAEASETAAAQGKFWQMHDLLFEHQAHLKPADLVRYARQLDLDMARYTTEMDDHIYLQRVREHIEGGKRSHLRATPTFFIDGVVHDVSFGMQSLYDAVAAALKRAGSTHVT